MRRFAVPSVRAWGTGRRRTCRSVCSIPVLVRCAPLPDRRALDAADLQSRLARFRRPAAEQRARDRPPRSPPRSSARAVRAAASILRSPLITGLSLSLLLRADEPWLHALAGVIAHRLEIRAAHRRQAHLESGGLRHRGAAVRAPGGVWISPGAVGLDGVVRGAAVLLRDPGAAAPRAAPTSRSSSSAATRRCCSRARSGSAIRSPFRCISCRAARC